MRTRTRRNSQWRPDTRRPPTLDEIRSIWPPAVDVTAAALALDIGESALYEAIAEGRAPVKVITVGRRMKVLTCSLIAVLEGTSARLGWATPWPSTAPPTSASPLT